MALLHGVIVMVAVVDAMRLANLVARHVMRRVMIIGDMRELGEQAPHLHVQAGRRVASRGVNVVIGVGELGRFAAVGGAEGGAEAHAFASVEEAAGQLPALLQAGDVVLIKGSRAMAMERLIPAIGAAFGAPAKERP